MFLKCRQRRKDGRVHRNGAIVESRRYGGGQAAHRHVLHLDELTDTRREAWQRTLEVIDERAGKSRRMALFPPTARRKNAGNASANWPRSKHPPATMG